MILRSVEIEHFGKFNAADFEFRRGMNLVTGPNEAGKSTLVEVIPAVLFGTRQVERFKPWGRSGCSASLVFEGDARSVEIRRNLLTDEVKVVERDALYQSVPRFEGKAALNGRSAACREYRLLLEQLLGIADDDLFRATCMFGQRVVEWTGDALGEKLRRLVSGSDETDFADILDALLDEHFELTRENPWGRDKQRDRELEQVRSMLEEQAVNLPATFAIASPDEEPELDERVRDLSAELERDRSEYVKGVCYVEKLRMNLQDPADTEEVGASSQKTETVPGGEASGTESADELSTRLVAEGLPEHPPENLPELLEEASRIRQELAEFQKPHAALAKSEGELKKAPWQKICILTTLLVCVVAAGWVFSFQPLVLSILGGAGLVGGWGWCLWRNLQHRRSLEDLKLERTKLEQVRGSVLTRQSELSERCEALGLPSSAIDLVRLQKVVEQNSELLDQWWSRNKTPEVPPVPVSKCLEDQNQESAASACENPEAATELAELEQRLGDFAAQLKEKELELARLKTRSSGQSAGVVESGEDTPVSDLQQKFNQIQQRVLVLREAVDLLVAGVEDYRQTHLVGLTEEAGRLFRKMTGGRYAQIRLDEDMRPELQIDGHRWHPADRFSRGTLDALYLALRIALSKVRGDGASLPLLLDDPFVHMDRERLSSTLKLLDMAASGGQLILLSHSEDLARRAARERWHVIPLGEGIAGTDNEDGDSHAGQLHLL
ncbi:MAG: AAA family ATPase [Desulfuromonadales bacterium]|nr:AAA family ATPase [Desulfuromonadales bacterium]